MDIKNGPRTGMAWVRRLSMIAWKPVCNEYSYKYVIGQVDSPGHAVDQLHAVSGCHT